MIESKAVANHLPKVSEYYNGKSIFITGATGYVGSILLEVLLRCCPGIKTIYILLREKRNVQPKDRKEQLFEKKIFEKIRNETPELIQKVCLIAGNISLPNLGMNDDDRHLIFQDVSVVFHCAAVLAFNKPLEFMVKNNVLSLISMIDLCRKIKNLEVLVYTSTAYSNCNHKMFPLKEEIYRLPFNAKLFIEAIQNEDKDKLQQLVAHCKPVWPNWYTFSKCLAENVIADTASDLPVAVIRPSIIFNTLEHPIPGYIENHFGVTKLFLGVGKGFVKVVKGDPDVKLNLVPADIVAKTHVLAACSVGTRRCPSMLVINCTATENLCVSVSEFTRSIIQLATENIIPQSFIKPTTPIITNNKYIHFLMIFYYHYVPAIALDMISKVLGKESRLFFRYLIMDKDMNVFCPFICNQFDFKTENMENLNKSTHFEDKKVLNLDMRNSTFKLMSASAVQGSDFYDWKLDKKSKLERQDIIHKRYFKIKCIRLAFLIICCSLISLAIFFVFY